MTISSIKLLATSVVTLGFASFISLAQAATHPELESRDIQDEVFYFVMPDRFANGSLQNDTGGIEGGREHHGFDPTDSGFYHGGDIVGLTQNLPYIKNLGVTSIWLTPIFKNQPVSIDATHSSYHGYWIQDYYNVDPHLGTNKELKTFVESAHDLGIKVFFDIVTNHTADSIRYTECHAEDGSFLNGASSCPYRSTSETPYTPFVPESLFGQKSPEWLNDPQYYHNQGDTTFSGESVERGDFFGLDDLDTENPFVVQGMIDIFKFWISEFKINGFRIDTARHVNIEFWQAFAPAIRAHADSAGVSDFFMFGETADFSPAKMSEYSVNGQLDSVLDFGTVWPMMQMAAWGGRSSDLADVYNNDDWYIAPGKDATSLLTFISNHDMGRVGVNLNSGYLENERLNRLKLAYAMLYFGRGIPVIYYGDEQGFVGHGGGDRESREDMMPSQVDSQMFNELIGTNLTTADDNFDPTHPMYQTLKSYAEVLNLHPALRSGKQHVRYASDYQSVIALSRVYDAYPTDYLVVYNGGFDAQTIVVDAMDEQYSYVYGSEQAEEALVPVDGQLSITVPPVSFVIYKGENKIEGEKVLSVQANLEAGRKFRGRFEFPVTIETDGNGSLPQVAVDFYLKHGTNEPEFIGTDYNAPYRIFPDTGDLEDGEIISVYAVARDLHGNKTQSESVDVEIGLEPGLEIFFQKPSWWADQVNIYYWGFPNIDSPNFPGVEMEAYADGWFRYQFPDGALAGNLFFSDANGNGSESFYRDESGCYISEQGIWLDSCDPPRQGITVNFLKPSGWGSQVNLNFATENEVFGTLPMENLVGDWWEVQLPNDVEAATIDFVDTNGNIEEAGFREGDGCFSNGAWSDSCDIVLPGLTIRFVPPFDWGADINIYYWNAGPQPPVGWPGTPMTYLGEGIYEFQFEPGVTSSNIIFNDGVIQTWDMYSSESSCFVDWSWMPIEACSLSSEQ